MKVPVLCLDVTVQSSSNSGEQQKQLQKLGPTSASLPNVTTTSPSMTICKASQARAGSKSFSSGSILGSSSGEAVKIISRSAQSHAFKKLKTPARRCKECNSYLYFCGLECHECGLTVHKKCASDLIIFCPHKRLQKKRTFGSQLWTQVHPDCDSIPSIVAKCISEIDQRGRKTKGLYRVSGVKSKVEKLCSSFDHGAELVDLSAVHPNIIANVLKLYLRQLPEPLMTHRLYPDFIRIAKQFPASVPLQQNNNNNHHSFRDHDHVHSHPDTESSMAGIEVQQMHQLVNLVSRLPKINFLTLGFIMHHLKRVSDKSQENSMTSNNLGIVFGPTLMTARDSASGSSLVDTVHHTRVIDLLITYAHQVFGSPLKVDPTGRILGFADPRDLDPLDSDPDEEEDVDKENDLCLPTRVDLFGENALPLLEPVRPDSGAEVSDSSCNSLQDSGGKTLNDMNSGESDRSKNKTSLSNLSRDSGLTASDTQLYSPGDLQDHDDAPEEKMFSLPAASVPASFERKKSSSPSSITKKSLHNNNNNHSIINNNSSKCVNRVLSSSIPHLNTDELESMLNGTFSYGKSVGIGITGSCQEVVRSRKRLQVLHSTPIPQQVHDPHQRQPHQPHQQQHQQQVSQRSLKCRSSLVTFDHCHLPSVTSVNVNNNSIHNNCINRFFSKSVPHLNSIGFRNSVTFSPTPRRATRVNLHGWSYDVSEASQRHNQSFPNDHYQALQADKCMYRCRATPFISYGSQPAPHLTPCYTRNNSSHNSNSITVNGKRLHSMSSLPTSQCTYSPFGTVCPPSYQETMDRKKFVARLQSNVSLFRKISFDGVYEQFELRL